MPGRGVRVGAHRPPGIAMSGAPSELRFRLLSDVTDPLTPLPVTGTLSCAT